MTDAQACTYAAMLLHDLKVAPTADKIATVLKAAGIEIRPTVPVLFASFLSKRSISDLITASAGAPVAASSGSAPAKKDEGKKEDAKKEEPKKKAAAPKPDEDDDLFGGGLF